MEWTGKIFLQSRPTNGPVLSDACCAIHLSLTPAPSVQPQGGLCEREDQRVSGTRSRKEPRESFLRICFAPVEELHCAWRHGSARVCAYLHNWLGVSTREVVSTGSLSGAATESRVHLVEGRRRTATSAS